MRWQDDYPSGMLRDASGGGLAPVDGAVLDFQALLKAWVPALVTELGVLSQLLQPLLSRTGTLLLEACSGQQAAGSWQQGSTAPACLRDVRVQPGTVAWERGKGHPCCSPARQSTSAPHCSLVSC